MTKYRFHLRAVTILFTMISLFVVPGVLTAGSRKAPDARKVVYEVSRNPDLLPVKIKLKLTPNKFIYNKGETVKLEFSIRIDKMNKEYKPGIKYAILNIATELERTGKGYGWIIESTNMKPKSIISDHDSELNYTIVMKCEGENPIQYFVSFDRITTKGSGKLSDEFGYYYDNRFSIMLFSNKVSGISRDNLLFKRSEKFIEWDDDTVKENKLKPNKGIIKGSQSRQ